jgi:succinylarginine dihydrolase
VPIADAIRSYLFNSQLVTPPDGAMTLVAPTECRETPSVAAIGHRLANIDELELPELSRPA